MNLKSLLRTVLISVIIYSSNSCLLGQNYVLNSDSSSYVQTFGKPLFIFKTYTFASNQLGKSRLEVFISFVNDIIQFVKGQEDTYKAYYEIVLEIMDADGNLQAGDIVKKEIVVHSYEETNARNIVNLNRFTFDLKPGNYELVLEITDLDTKRHLTRNRDVELRNFENATVAMSDLMFVDSIKFDSSQVTKVIPNMRKTLDEPSSEFGVFFELYNWNQDTIKLNYGVYDLENSPLVSESNIFDPRQKVIRKFIPLKNLVNIPGSFVLVVEAKANNAKTMARDKFFIQYTNESFSLESFRNSLAYMQCLKHITSNSDFSKIEKASAKERLKLIKQFWKERDPTPETEENELKEEFLRRVQFTLRHFHITTKDRPGWDTDRGKIYVIYGPPSEVQRESVDLGSNPFEVWYYKKIDKRFIFLDKSGLGDYRLVHKD